MQLPNNLAIIVENQEDVEKVSLICNSYGLYWSVKHKLLPLGFEPFTGIRYIIFNHNFLQDHHLKTGYRLMYKSIVYDKELISVTDFIKKYG